MSRNFMRRRTRSFHNRTDVTFVMAKTGVQNIQQVMQRETVLGATGRSSMVAVYPSLLNHVVGTKFKIVLGYAGSAQAIMAMECGEVEGHSIPWEGLKSRAEQHLRDKTINVLVQYGLQRHPELPDIPTSVELGRSAEDVEALGVFANASDLGRFILSTPDTPPERIEALRRAFDAMVKEPNFIADLKRQRLELGPLTGEELQRVVANVSKVSIKSIERVRGIYPVD